MTVPGADITREDLLALYAAGALTPAETAEVEALVQGLAAKKAA